MPNELIIALQEAFAEADAVQDLAKLYAEIHNECEKMLKCKRVRPMANGMCKAECDCQPDYEAEYNRLMNENQLLKKEIEELHMTVIEMCKTFYISRFTRLKEGADNG